jgi:hypothetical protein
MTTEETPDEQTDERPAQSGESSTDVKAPFAPHEDDDSEMGDTDQHSDA